jgi:hypothetical protein
MNYFDSDMSNRTTTVVYFDGKDGNFYVCGQCDTQFILLNMYFYDGKVSLIDGAPATLILCLHVVIAHRIFMNFGHVDYFQ